VLLDPQLYALFLAAALLLTLAPGPDTMFVLGASLGGGARGGLQLLLLGMSHWLMGLPYLCAVAPASGAMAGWLQRSPGIRRGLDGVAGMVFVGLALRLVLAQRKPA
jgi:threonine/homoserine/homoserine lactone efflux protein